MLGASDSLLGPFPSTDQKTEMFSGWKLNRRNELEAYDVWRNLGLILLGASILGLFGMGTTSVPATVAIGLIGTALITLAHFRPTKVGDFNER